MSLSPHPVRLLWAVYSIGICNRIDFSLKSTTALLTYSATPHVRPVPVFWLCFVFCVLCVLALLGRVCVLCFCVLAMLGGSVFCVFVFWRRRPQNFHLDTTLRGMLTLAVTHSDSGAASDPPCEEPVGAPAPRLQTPKPDLRAAVVSRALAGLVGVHSVGVRECRGGGI